RRGQGGTAGTTGGGRRAAPRRFGRHEPGRAPRGRSWTRGLPRSETPHTRPAAGAAAGTRSISRSSDSRGVENLGVGSGGPGASSRRELRPRVSASELGVAPQRLDVDEHRAAAVGADAAKAAKLPERSIDRLAG